MIGLNIPAGLIDETQVEFFAHEGVAMALYKGSKWLATELPDVILDAVRDEMLKDSDVVKALIEMGRTDDKAMLNQFICCRFGAFDMVADVNHDADLTHEYWDCGLRGICKHEGKICKSIAVGGKYLTKRELEIIKLISQGLLDKEIADSMGISENTVPVHKRNLMQKIGAKTKVDIAVFAINHRLI